MPPAAGAGHRGSVIRTRAVDARRPGRLHSDLFGGTREGSLALLRDLHDLYLMCTESDISWIVIKQAAQGLQDRDLVSVVEACEGDTTRQLQAIKTRIKQAAPQTLIAAS